MKKYVMFTLFLVTVLALAACGSAKDKKDPTPASSEATTQTVDDDDDDDDGGAVGTVKEPTPVELNASDYVELGKYKDLTIEVEQREVTEADVDEEIENYLEGYAEYKEVKDRDVVKEGDYVNLDYSCIIDGKKSDEYSDKDIDVKAADGEMDEYLGSGLGADFQLENKVIGSKVGSTVSVDFTFPQNYDDSSVAGKSCKMEVKINKISEEIIPELNDAFVKEYTESKTVDDYRKETRNTLEEQAQAETDDAARDKLWNTIVDNAKLKKEFTADMIAKEVENVKIRNQEVAEFYYGMNVEDFIKETSDMTLEEYAKFSLKAQCVQDLLMEAENIKITDEAFQKQLEEIAKESGLEKAEDVTEYYSKDEIRQELISSQLFEKLNKYNTIKTVPAKSE